MPPVNLFQPRSKGTQQVDGNLSTFGFKLLQTPEFEHSISRLELASKLVHTNGTSPHRCKSHPLLINGLFIWAATAKLAVWRCHIRCFEFCGGAVSYLDISCWCFPPKHHIHSGHFSKYFTTLHFSEMAGDFPKPQLRFGGPGGVRSLLFDQITSISLDPACHWLHETPPFARLTISSYNVMTDPHRVVSWRHTEASHVLEPFKEAENLPKCILHTQHTLDNTHCFRNFK